MIKLTMPAHDLTFTAVWEYDTTFEVSYNLVYGSTVDSTTLPGLNSTPAQSPSNGLNVDCNVFGKGLSIDHSSDPTFITPQVDGYTFVRWYYIDHENGDQKVTLDPQTTTVGTVISKMDKSSSDYRSHRAMIYAEFTANHQDITFHANDGTDNTHTQTDASQTTGAQVTLTKIADFGTDASKFVRTGYTFKGWNSNAAGTGTSYEDGAAYTLAANNNDFYAQWEAKNYTVKFLGGGATGGSMANATFTYDGTGYTDTLPNSGFTRDGYRFTGWKDTTANKTYTAGTDTYANLDVSSADANNTIELTAQWQKEATVSFDANGGTLNSGETAPSAITQDAESTFTLPGNIYSKTGYSQNGWNTRADGTGTHYDASATPTLSDNTTLYAEWQANSNTAYSIDIYEQQVDGNYPGAPTNVLTDASYVGTTGTPATGYSVTPSSGFELDENATGTDAHPIIAADGSTHVKLYYKRKVFDATLNPYKTSDGSDPVPESSNIENGPTTSDLQDIVYGSDVTLPTPSAIGYDFEGWTVKDENGNNVEVTQSGDSYTFTQPNSKVTIEGTFSLKSFTVTYVQPTDTTRGTVTGDPETVKYNHSPLANGVSATATDDYYFANWRITPAGDESQTLATAASLDELKAYKVTQDVHVVAVFGAVWTVAYTTGQHGVFDPTTQIHEGIHNGSAWVGFDNTQNGALDTAATNAKNAGNPAGRLGYIFDGWTWKDTSGVSHDLTAENTPATVTTNYSFVAKWKPSTQTISITLDNTAGYTGTDWTKGSSVLTTTGQTEGTITLPSVSEMPTRPGQTLVGFTGSVTSPVDDTHTQTATKTYEPGQTIDVPLNDATFTPVYKENVVTITYTTNETNGGADMGTIERTSEKLGALNGRKNVEANPDAGPLTSATPLGCTPTANPGYRFVGWTISTPDGEAVSSDWVANGTNKLTPRQASVSGVNVYEEATYVANFEPISYSLTFTSADSHGTISKGVNVPGTLPYQTKLTAAQAADISTNAVAGYELAGWDYSIENVATGTTTTGTVSATADLTQLPITGNATFTAKWKASAATATFTNRDADSGEPASTSIEGVTDGTISAPGRGSMVKRGYDFVGWTLDGDDNGQVYEPSDSITLPAGGATFNPKWSAHTYTVSYNVNATYYPGVSGSVASTSASYGATLNVSDGTGVTPNTGWHIESWNTKPDGTGTTINLGDELNWSAVDISSGTVTLYARYAQNDVTITLEPNGGVGEAKVIHGHYGDTGYALPEVDTVFSPAQDMEFVSWSVTNDWHSSYFLREVGTVIDFPAEGNTTIYATWKASKPYTLSYLKRDGSVLTSQGYNLTDKLNPVAESNVTDKLDSNYWNFSGWKVVSIVGTPQLITSDMTIVDVARYNGNFDSSAQLPSITEYQVREAWALKNYDINFDSNIPGGAEEDSSSTAMSQITKGATESFTLPRNTYAVKGYTFAGWNTKPDGNGTWYSDGQANVSGLTQGNQTTGEHAVTLYAQWNTRSDYGINYYNDGETTVPDSQASGLRYNDVVNSKDYPTDPVNPDTSYAFEGWYTEPNGAGTKVDPGTTTIGQLAEIEAVTGYDGSVYGSPEQRVQLYAAYTQNGVHVDYDTNTESYNNKVVGDAPTGTSVASPLLPITVSANTLTLLGYNANGWNTKADGSGDNYADNAQFLPGVKGSYTLYAQFSPKNYTLVFDKQNGDEVYTSPNTYKWSDSNLLTTAPKNVTRAGYTPVTNPDGSLKWFAEPQGTDPNAGTVITNDLSISDIRGTDDADGTGHPVTLYLHWIERSDYKVVLNTQGQGLNDPSIAENKTVTNVKWSDVVSGTIPADYKNLTSSYAHFDGWYLDSSYNEALGESVAVSDVAGKLTGENGDTLNLYAKWSPNTVALQFLVDESAGGTHAKITEGASELTQLTRNTTALAGEDAVAAVTAKANAGYTIEGVYKRVTSGGSTTDTKLSADDGVSINSTQSSVTITPKRDGSVWKDATYVIKTKAKTVPYSIEYYKQNTNDDGYTLDAEASSEASEGLEAAVDSTVSTTDNGGALEKTFTGFTLDKSIANTVSTGTIPATGKLVLKL